jgi:hypothetical protein
MSGPKKHSYIVEFFDRNRNEKVVCDAFMTTDHGDLVFLTKEEGSGNQAKVMVAYAAGAWRKVCQKGISLELNIFKKKKEEGTPA